MKDITPGIIVQGYVKHTANNTLYVALSRTVTGRVFFKNLSNKFIKNPSKKFPIGKLVTGRVISINDDFIDLSLKKSDVQQKRVAFEELKIDQVVKGFVKRLDTKFGVFVTLKDCGLVGLCHFSEVDDEYVKPEDLKNRFKIKDAVQARIIRLNPEKKQISLTLKPSKLEGVEESESSSESEEESQEEEEEEVEETNTKKETEKKGKKTKVLVPVDGGDSDDDAILNEARDQDEDDSDEIEQDEDEEEDENEQAQEDSSEEEVKPHKNKKETKKKDLSHRILTPSGYAFADAMSDSDDENYVSKLAEQMSSDEFEDDEEMAEDDDEDNSGDEDDRDDNEEAMQVDEDQEDSEKEVKQSSKKQPKTEGISVGFDWNDADDNEADEESDDDGDSSNKKKLVVTQKQAEESDGDGLNTSEDFEKSLFANPNSSYLWIRYIAYWVRSEKIY